ncbi:uncharacterized protein FOMMEDRAFT_160536 [Fomitiporia mediterranea MF3/22]|uniref:uncharacterized protein n=1 Tax=Fomitiporia mediterranea (strain MF3/22) TaxID=694068 RepID=UPI00044097D7|nr:uncharacterized protein FOMMEDRAFT_160536 [Fomitiporia mediterranea MF3/22]EJC99477.1 hypothetical protein FOMMEDRAFT_160536 [Fomitiporia mediterranea MF3/22]
MPLSVRDNPDALDPSLVQEFFSEEMTQQYWLVATMTLLVYDAIITIDREIEFFWGHQLTKPVNLVYFIASSEQRHGYSPTYWMLTEACVFSQWAFVVSAWVTIISIDYILMIRVLALYSRQKSLTTCLATLLGLEAASKFAIVVYGTLVEQTSILPLTEGTSICLNNGGILTIAIIDWTIPLVYGLILMSLALYKAAGYWKIEAGLKGFKLVRVLIRDQMIYFILAVSCCIFNIMEFKVDTSVSLALLLEQFGSRSFLCILGSRVFFNMKEAGKLGVNEGTSYRMKSVSNIEFKQPVGSDASTNDAEGSEDASRV